MNRKPIIIPVVLTGTPYSLGRYVIPTNDPDWKLWRAAAKSGAKIEMGDSRILDVS